MKFVFNAGHAPNGNPDPGAVNERLGLRECDIALELANRTAEYMRAIGHEAYVIQNDDLDAIVDYANNMNADRFISIHMNSFYNEEANGTEVYWYGSDAGCHLAECVQNQLIDTMGTTDRGTKEYGYYVVKYTDMPAILIETAFISNDSDATYVVNHYDDIARAIARGITDSLQ